MAPAGITTFRELPLTTPSNAFRSDATFVEHKIMKANTKPDPYLRKSPPLTSMIWAVTKLISGETSALTTPAISAG
jgi:hypothetical protein